MIAPLELGENPASWLQQAAQHGQPALVPVRMHGQPALASLAVVHAQPALRTARRNPSREVRAALAIDACRRARAWARLHGATT